MSKKCVGPCPEFLKQNPRSTLRADRGRNQILLNSDASCATASCLVVGGRLGAYRLLLAAITPSFFLLRGRAARTPTIFTARTTGAITRLAFAIRAHSICTTALGASAIFSAATGCRRSAVRFDGKRRNRQKCRNGGNRQTTQNF